MELIADNLRITKADILDAFKAHDAEPVQKLAARCVAKGLGPLM